MDRDASPLMVEFITYSSFKCIKMFNPFLVSKSLSLTNLQKIVVEHIYADHNKSKPVQRVIRRLVQQNSGGVMVNIGAGDTKIHSNIINLDLKGGPNVDIIASADNIPLLDNSVCLVICQEMLEHVPVPLDVLLEIHRVLRKNGTLYLQVPWTIGYHGCPQDFWRFSRDGISQIVLSAGFVVQELGVTVGPFTGFYRVAVETFGILGSLLSERLYKPFKLSAALILLPIKIFDLFSLNSKEAHRLAGGFFVVAMKEG